METLDPNQGTAEEKGRRMSVEGARGLGASALSSSNGEVSTSGTSSGASEPEAERRDYVNWQDEANCVGVDPNVFFPERGASTREAKEICRGCVVRLECLDFAISNGEKFGIWGGLSERERRRLRRQRALAARKVTA